VVSDAGGNLEVVQPGETGVVAPLADEACLAGAVAGLLTDPERAARLAHRARAGLGRFAWPALVEQTEAVLLEAVAAARR
jgi:glycosyltransferase involved in cell wall biosynthesis